MKKFLPFLVFTAILVTGVFATILVLNLSKVYNERSNKASECALTGKEYRVTLHNNEANPNNTDAKLCDKLTITNQDTKLRLVAFGEHDEHRSYDGISEKFLDRGEGLQITLNRPGTFNFHDHLDESVAGKFTVSE